MTDVALLLGRMLLVSIFIYLRRGETHGRQWPPRPTSRPRACRFLSSWRSPRVVTEAVGGLLILVGWYTRFAAVVLLLFTGAALFLFHDFWNLPAGRRAQSRRWCKPGRTCRSSADC